jgi:hypothetical protein
MVRLYKQLARKMANQIHGESDSRLGANRIHEPEMWQPSAKMVLSRGAIFLT